MKKNFMNKFKFSVALLSSLLFLSGCSVGAVDLITKVEVKDNEETINFNKNKTRLENIIKTLEQIDRDAYEDESLEQIDKALENAKNALDNEDSSEGVELLIASLENTVKNLKEKEDYVADKPADKPKEPENKPDKPKEPEKKPEEPSKPTGENFFYPSSAQNVKMIAGIAVAEIKEKGVIKNNTYFSEGPGEPGDVSGFASYGELKVNDEVSVIGVSMNGFVMISANGNQGFVPNENIVKK